MTLYFLEVGILLTKENPEFDNYSKVYDRRCGYYDEDRWCVIDSELAVKEAIRYVENGVDRTYAVVSTGPINNADGVIFSIAKIDGQIIEGFINTAINPEPIIDDKS